MNVNFFSKKTMWEFLTLWVLFGVLVTGGLVIHGFTTFEYKYDVPRVVRFDSLETNYLYAWIHLWVFLPVFLLSFDKKVYYASRFRYLFPAIFAVAVPFLIWDYFFTAGGVWEFNESYLTGFRILGLPWEEYMFFFTVPFACVFIYDCLNAYFPKNRIILWERPATILIGIALIVLAVVFISEIYTLTACAIAFMSLVWIRRKGEISFLANFYRAFLVTVIPFLLVDGILTGGYTNAPIVLYNEAHFSGFRFVSIPIEDMIYGFALLLQLNYLYVKWSRRRA
ncbi:MAG: lycopene cyclase domain-containing protein [Saprospirales bacterium]|nr:MAG: lycopene cyclase domain-containing protein [Saprospirales bacterium]